MDSPAPAWSDVAAAAAVTSARPSASRERCAAACSGDVPAWLHPASEAATSTGTTRAQRRRTPRSQPQRHVAKATSVNPAIRRRALARATAKATTPTQPRGDERSREEPRRRDAARAEGAVRSRGCTPCGCDATPRGRGCYKYWPVLPTVSIDLPASGPLPETSVRMYTIRSPFLPEMRAQSSGFVVFGRSSFSRNSSTHAASRCDTRSPLLPLVSRSLIAIFFARSTMFWIIAPELKSLKYRVSLSPFA